MARHWAFEPSTWYHYLPVPLGKSLQLSCGKSQSGTPSPQKRSVKASWMVSRCFSYKSASSFGILNSIAFPGSVKICWQCSCGCFHLTYHDYSNNKRIVTTSPRYLQYTSTTTMANRNWLSGQFPAARFPILLGSVLVEVYNGPNAMAVQVIHQLPDYLVPISISQQRGELRFSEDLFIRNGNRRIGMKDVCYVYLYDIQLHTWLLACLYLIHIYIPGQVICIDVYELALELCAIRVPTPMYHSTLMCQNVPKLATGGKFCLTLPTTNYTKD